MTKAERKIYDKAYRLANKEKREKWAKDYKENNKDKLEPVDQVKEMPYDFWNYCINPILGYRYMPDDKNKPRFLKNKLNAATTTKS